MTWSVGYAVVTKYQKWSKEEKPVYQRQGHGHPRLSDTCGEWWLAHLVRSDRRVTVAKIAENVTAGYDRKISEHIQGYLATDQSEHPVLYCIGKPRKIICGLEWKKTHNCAVVFGLYYIGVYCVI